MLNNSLELLFYNNSHQRETFTGHNKIRHFCYFLHNFIEYLDGLSDDFTTNVSLELVNGPGIVGLYFAFKKTTHKEVWKG